MDIGLIFAYVKFIKIKKKLYHFNQWYNANFSFQESDAEKSDQDLVVDVANEVSLH